MTVQASHSTFHFLFGGTSPGWLTGVRQDPEGSGEQRNMEKTGCEIMWCPNDPRDLGIDDDEHQSGTELNFQECPLFPSYIQHKNSQFT